MIQIQVPLKSSLPLAGDQSKIDDVPKPNQVPSEVKQTEVQAGEEQKKAGKKEKKPKGEKKGRIYYLISLVSCISLKILK